MNASKFSCGAGHELAITAAKAGWELEDFSTLTRSEEKCREVLLLLRGEADLVLKTKPVPSPEPEVVIDPIIRVDYSIRPSYPDWMKKVMHPDLEGAGLAEYDISTVEQWLHEGQENGIEGTVIYDHLKTTNTLKNCFGTRDLEEIKKKGIEFFRKYFKGKAVLGWKGLVQHRIGDLLVPYLYEVGVGVVLGWRWVGNGFFGYYPALRHASTKV